MINPADLSRPHLFRAGNDRTLILLHGTGANEHDLVPLADLLIPGATLLSPRGMNTDEGMNRFFARNPDGTFVQESIVEAVSELSEFFAAAEQAYDFDLSKSVAVGFSNGGNTALALLLTNPNLISGVVAFGATNPMPQLTELPDLTGKKVFISNGIQDPYAPEAVTAKFVETLRAAGAEVHWLSHAGGHSIVGDHVVEIAQQI